MLRRKDYGSAVQEFRMRLYDHPDDKHAQLRLAECESVLAAFALNDEGVALVRANDMEAAIERFKRAIAAKSDFFVPYKNLSSVLHKMDRNEEAEVYARRARRLERPLSGPALPLASSRPQ